jgi:hypothetical protein
MAGWSDKYQPGAVDSSGEQTGSADSGGGWSAKFQGQPDQQVPVQNETQSEVPPDVAALPARQSEQLEGLAMPTINDIDQMVERRKASNITPSGLGFAELGMMMLRRKKGGVDTQAMMVNTPESALRYGENVAHMAMNPLDTAENLRSLGQGVVEKLIPDEINGTDFGPTENEQKADIVGAHYVDRYGSADKIRRTMESDPVGMLADVAGVASLGALAIPGKAGQAARITASAADPLNAAARVAKASYKAAAKNIPKALPGKMLETVLKFPPRKGTDNAARRASMIDTMLDKSIMPTVGGMRKVADTIVDLNTRMDAVIDSAVASGNARGVGSASYTVPVNIVYSELGKLRKSMGGMKLEGGKDLRTIDKVEKAFAKHVNQNLGGRKVMTVAELQAFKKDIHQLINWDMKGGAVGRAKNETRIAMASGARKGVERVSPEVKGINQDMGKLLELRPELEGAVNRLGNNHFFSLLSNTKIMAGAGVDAAVGLPGVASGVAVGSSIVGSPRIKAGAALLMHNMRKHAETVEILGKLPLPMAQGFLQEAGDLGKQLSEMLPIEFDLNQPENPADQGVSEPTR